MTREAYKISGKTRTLSAGHKQGFPEEDTFLQNRGSFKKGSLAVTVQLALDLGGMFDK